MDGIYQHKNYYFSNNSLHGHYQMVEFVFFVSYSSNITLKRKQIFYQFYFVVWARLTRVGCYNWWDSVE